MLSPKHAFLFSLILIPVCDIYSQNKTQSNFRIFTDSTRKIFWQKDLPAHLFFATDSAGTDLIKPYAVSGTDKPGGAFLFKSDGKQLMEQLSPKKERKNAFELYADGTAPVSILQISEAPLFKDDKNTLFYGKGLDIGIKSTDAVSGVDKIFFKLQDSLASYSQKLGFAQAGDFDLQYFANDRVGNEEAEKSYKFTVDVGAPATALGTSGDKHKAIYAGNVSINLTPKDDRAGVAYTKYRLDGGDFKPYSSKLLASAMPDGDHFIEYFSEDRVKNLEATIAHKFQVDKTPPSIVPEIFGDQHQNRGRIFISTRSRVKFNVNDAIAGLDRVVYSVDGGEEIIFNDPFELEKTQGKHLVKYKAIDRVKNETLGSFDDSYGRGTGLAMDVVPPLAMHEFIGPQYFSNDTLFVNSLSRIAIKASDKDTGIKMLGFKIGDNKGQYYKTPFGLDGADGSIAVNYFATDMANNRMENDFVVKLDNTPPKVFYDFGIKAYADMKTPAAQAGENPSFPSGVMVYLAATDAMTNVKTIYYRIDGGPEQVYAAPFSVKAVGAHSLKIRAVDVLDNEGKAEEVKFSVR